MLICSSQHAAASSARNRLCSTKSMTDFNIALTAGLRIYRIIPCLALLSKLGNSDVTAVALLALSNARHHLAAVSDASSRQACGGGSGGWHCWLAPPHNSRVSNVKASSLMMRIRCASGCRGLSKKLRSTVMTADGTLKTALPPLVSHDSPSV